MLSTQRAWDDMEASDSSEDDKPLPPFITVREAARRANIPSRTLYNWIRAGTWPVRVIKYSEHTYHVRLDEFEVWLEARRADRGE